MEVSAQVTNQTTKSEDINYSGICLSSFSGNVFCYCAISKHLTVQKYIIILRENKLTLLPILERLSYLLEFLANFSYYFVMQQNSF